MSCGEDHSIEILLEIENCDGGNHSEVERRPGVAAVGRSKDADISGGQHRVSRRVVAIDQQAQHRNVGQRARGRGNLQGWIAVGLRP
jgi:hypothetical protein